MYYLRHLIQLDETTFNIPYIILRHMQSAYRSTVAYLPYAHLIHKIIRLNDIDLPSDQPFFFPQHLVDQLTRIGWVQSNSASGLMRFKPDGWDINEWIFHPEALPNQYWDPEEMAQDPPIQIPPVNQPPFVYQPMPQAGQPVPFPPIPQSLEEQMFWMCQRMQEQHFNIRTMQDGMTKIEGQMQEHTRAIRILDQRQESLMTRFVKRFGTSSSSVPSTREEEEEDVNEKVEEEDAREQNPNQNPNE